MPPCHLAATPPTRNLFGMRVGWEAPRSSWHGTSPRAHSPPNLAGMRAALEENLRQAPNLADQLHQSRARNLSHLLAPLSPTTTSASRPAGGSRTSLWRAAGIFGIFIQTPTSDFFGIFFLHSNFGRFLGIFFVTQTSGDFSTTPNFHQTSLKEVARG